MKPTPELQVINCPKIAMAYIGWGKPRVVVTTGAHQKLTHEEFWALVGHELGHWDRRHYEQRRLFLIMALIGFSCFLVSGYLVAAACLFVALIFCDYCMRFEQELQADAFAAKTQGAQHLQAALLKIAEEQPRLWKHRLFRERIRRLEVQL